MTATLWRLLSIAAPTKALPALLAALLAACAGIALIAAAAWIIASAALQPPLSALALAITLVRTCGIGRAVFRYLDRLLSHRMAFDCYERLQQETYHRAAASIPMREGNVREGAFLHDLLRGCETLRDFYLRSLPQPLIAGILTLLTCTALLPLIPSGIVPILALYVLHLTLPHLFRMGDLRTESAAYRSDLMDYLDGRTELLAAGTTSAAKRALDAAAADFQQKELLRSKKREHIFTLLDVLRVSVWILLIILLTPQVAGGSLTGVQYAVWVLLLEAVLSEYRGIPAASLGAIDALKAAENILPQRGHKPIQQHVSSAQKKAADAPLLAVDHLSFGYQEGIPILQDLSFTVRHGQHTAIIGESGAGKTTLAGILLRLFEPDGGTIRYGDIPHTELTPPETRALFGASLQGSYLFSTSVRDNFLRLHGNISEDAMWRALTAAQLADIVRALPRGLDEPLGANAGHLSGGQRSRLLTALALVSDAPLLVLDEPTAGLDAERGAHLIESILAALDQRGGTLIVITHDLPLLDHMKQVITL